MEAEFGYRTEKITRGTSSSASAVDERGTAVGNQRDGHRAELEGYARNAGQAVSAANAAWHRFENAPDQTGSTDRFDRDAGKRSRICKTGWESEREVFFRLQKADQYGTEIHDDDFDRYEEPTYGYGSGREEENSPVRVDLDYSGDLVRGAVRLGRAVEQMTDDAPQHDTATMPPYIDSKRRKKLRQKKTALGHAEDDHEEMRMDTM